MYVPVSPKHSLLVLFKVNPVPSVCVKVVSLSAPKDKTEESVLRAKSFVIATSPTLLTVNKSVPPAVSTSRILAL